MCNQLKRSKVTNKCPQERFEDPKGITRSCKSENGQCNDQNKEGEKTNNDPQKQLISFWLL